MQSTAVSDLASLRWREEVDALLQAAPGLAPAARAMVSSVLHSLADEPTTDAETLADVRLLLEAVDGGHESHRTREVFVRIGQRLVAELAAA